MSAGKARIGGLVVVLVICLAVFGWIMTRPAEKPPMTPVALQLAWTHSGGFSGYYMADQNGDYAERGINLTILEGGPRKDTIKTVVSGEAQFALANAAQVIIARASGSPIRALGCLYTRSPLVVATLRQSGITHPRQFAGLKIRASRENQIIVKAMASRFGVSTDQIVFSEGRDLAPFYDGEIDAWTGYLSVSVRQMNEDGQAVNIIHPDNYGVHFYYECLVARDDFISQNRDLVRDFVHASYAIGWPEAIRDSVKAAMMARRYSDKIDPDLEQKKIAIQLPMIRSSNGRVGVMDSKDWSGMIAALNAHGLLARDIGVNDVVVPEYVDSGGASEGTD